VCGEVGGKRNKGLQKGVRNESSAQTSEKALSFSMNSSPPLLSALVSRAMRAESVPHRPDPNEGRERETRGVCSGKRRSGTTEWTSFKMEAVRAGKRERV